MNNNLYQLSLLVTFFLVFFTIFFFINLSKQLIIIDFSTKKIFLEHRSFKNTINVSIDFDKIKNLYFDPSINDIEIKTKNKSFKLFSYGNYGQNNTLTFEIYTLLKEHIK